MCVEGREEGESGVTSQQGVYPRLTPQNGWRGGVGSLLQGKLRFGREVAQTSVGNLPQDSLVAVLAIGEQRVCAPPPPPLSRCIYGKSPKSPISGKRRSHLGERSEQSVKWTDSRVCVSSQLNKELNKNSEPCWRAGKTKCPRWPGADRTLAAAARDDASCR